MEQVVKAVVEDATSLAQASTRQQVRTTPYHTPPDPNMHLSVCPCYTAANRCKLHKGSSVAADLIKFCVGYRALDKARWK